MEGQLEVNETVKSFLDAHLDDVSTLVRAPALVEELESKTQQLQQELEDLQKERPVPTLSPHARESCPVWPGQPIIAHSGTRGPCAIHWVSGRKERLFLEGRHARLPADPDFYVPAASQARPASSRAPREAHRDGARVSCGRARSRGQASGLNEGQGLPFLPTHSFSRDTNLYGCARRNKWLWTHGTLGAQSRLGLARIRVRPHQRGEGRPRDLRPSSRLRLRSRSMEPSCQGGSDGDFCRWQAVDSPTVPSPTCLGGTTVDVVLERAGKFRPPLHWRPTSSRACARSSSPRR